MASPHSAFSNSGTFTTSEPEGPNVTHLVRQGSTGFDLPVVFHEVVPGPPNRFFNGGPSFVKTARDTGRRVVLPLGRRYALVSIPTRLLLSAQQRSKRRRMRVASDFDQV